MSNVDIAVFDDDGNEQPRNVVGEIVITSKAVAEGYVMGEPPGETPFKGDSYWTGDIGFVDDDGFVHLSGRKSEIINVGGLKVSPHEVVLVLERFPAVNEAAAVGVKSGSGEEVVCAVVTLHRPATEDSIIAYCRDNLADYKVPRRVEIRDELPRGATGKVKLTAADLCL